MPCHFVKCFLTILLAVSNAEACIWDRDTLATEAKGIPNVISTITGRFDRYPARYYEMRRDRVLVQIQQEPDKLDLYDDLAVCYDRLGDATTAIEWMAKKRLQLNKIPQDLDHEYRYLANLGTFHAHRWLKFGADFEDLSDINEACRLITEAINLNPDAHFGRELYQLKALQWLRKIPSIVSEDESEETVHPLGTKPEGRYQIQLNSSPESTDSVLGYSGLITLGAAWQSYDIFHALLHALRDDGRHAVAHLTLLRLRELEANGNTSLVAKFNSIIEPRSLLLPRSKKHVQKFYLKARKEAQHWQANRLGYMESQFDKGYHPDTHPHFWDDYSERSKAPRPPGLLATDPVYILARLPIIAFIACLGIAGILVFRFIKECINHRKSLR